VNRGVAVLQVSKEEQAHYLVTHAIRYGQTICMQYEIIQCKFDFSENMQTKYVSLL
jgi:hypothetical protein